MPENLPLVLIIEDDQDNAAALGFALSTETVRVERASDGAAGLATAIVKNPDLIVLDLMLPRMSGFLFLETIRQEYEIDCPIIVMTGNEGQRHYDYAQMLGVQGYFRKPFRLDELVDHVVRLLDSVGQSPTAA